MACGTYAPTLMIASRGALQQLGERIGWCSVVKYVRRLSLDGRYESYTAQEAIAGTRFGETRWPPKLSDATGP